MQWGIKILNVFIKNTNITLGNTIFNLLTNAFKVRISEILVDKENMCKVNSWNILVFSKHLGFKLFLLGLYNTITMEL